jgi:hypothetical protein
MPGILGGGGASLPDDPAAVLLDAGAPGTLVALNGSGVGVAMTFAEALETLYEAVPVDLTDDTGWTARGGAGSGTATINTGSERIDLSCSSGAGEAFASIGREPWSTAATIDIRARLALFTASADADHYALTHVADALAQAVYAGVNIKGNNTAMLESSTGNGSPISVASLTGGQGWARIVVRGTLFRCYVGVGSGGAQPTSWTDLGSTTITGTRPTWPIVLYQCGRGAGGDTTVQWSTISYTEYP